MDRHLENSIYIAEFLKKNEAVEKIYYPGLPEHEGYELQKKQAKGPGAMISFILKPSYDINKFVKSLRIITFGESLGGVESLLTHPASMTHGAIPYDLRQEMGIVDELVRLSVGIENKQDLIDDLQQAINCAKA